MSQSRDMVIFLQGKFTWMNRFFYKIGLIDEITVVSKTSKETIIKRLKDIIDLNIPFELQERKGKRFYEGDVTGDKFSFRRKKSFFWFDQDSETLVKVSGTISEDQDRVIIKACIAGQTKEFLLTWGIVAALFFAISMLLNMNHFRWDTVLLAIGALIYFVLYRYITLRKGVSKMTRTVDLELNNIGRPENGPQQAQ